MRNTSSSQSGLTKESNETSVPRPGHPCFGFKCGSTRKTKFSLQKAIGKSSWLFRFGYITGVVGRARCGCAAGGWRSLRAHTWATCSARRRPTPSPEAPAVWSTTTTRASLRSGSTTGSISTTILTRVRARLFSIESLVVLVKREAWSLVT